MQLRVGQEAPDFTLPSHLGGEIHLRDLRGKNVAIAFFPMAWTPIWTGQIPSYEAAAARFAGLDTQVLGISVDHIPCLKAWAESLGGINYPLLSDFWPHGNAAMRYGVLREDGVTERAIFVIDKEGIIRYIDIHDIDQQPDNEVLFTELARLQPAGAAGVGQSQPLITEADFASLPREGIVIYCTPWCPDCKKARLWLKACNLPYTEVDISRNRVADAQVRRWNGGEAITPTFNINGTIFSGFDERQLSVFLKL